MSQEKKSQGRLVAAAEALEIDMARYEQLVVGLQRERLDSEKNLQRAAQMLATLSEIGTRLGEHLVELLGAIEDLRGRQEALVARVQPSAESIKQRGEILGTLLQRWAKLGEHAAEVNQLAQRPPDQGREGNGSGAAFAELDGRLTQLADETESFAETAEAEQFIDLARQAKSLRSQIQSVRNKLRLARPV